MSDRFAAAQHVADAVLYEGYLLYPYRATSGKNRVRFQFGVIVPRDRSEPDSSETWEMQTECLVEPGADPRLDIRIRFLQLQARTVEIPDDTAADGYREVPAMTVDGEEFLTWDEAVEGVVDMSALPVRDLSAASRDIPFTIDGGHEVESIVAADGSVAGRIVRTRWPIAGRAVVAADQADGAGGLVKLRIRVENITDSAADAPGQAGGRDALLRHSMLGCHTLLAIGDGAFVSLIDPPAAALDAVGTCSNHRTWPVLVGEEGSRDLMLSSPIILYDYPAIAPESGENLFDSTEIDEILTLRIMTLGDDEKRAARATDPRARRIIDAADDMAPEILDRLHGAIRYLRKTPNRSAPPPVEPDWPTMMNPSIDAREMPPSVWEPDARVAPDRMVIEIDGIQVGKGATVRLRPNRRADSMDLFLDGRLATVEAVFESVDEEVFVAITVDDDPATDLHREYGRFFYFAPDELQVVNANPSSATPAAVAT
jgi:hypothetical protein